MTCRVCYLYLASRWKIPFDPKRTEQAEFHVSENKTVEVPMMSTGSLVTPYFRDEELGCTLVELTYTSNDSALFILPDEGKMQDLEAKLTPEMLTRWRNSLQPRLIDTIYLPKFSISSDYNLQHFLSELGIQKVFTSEADLSGITDVMDLEVSQMVHSAVLDVDEVGTEGAAATGVELSFKSAFRTIVRFDRPFLIAVVLKDTQKLRSELWVPSLRSRMPRSLGAAWPLGTEDPPCLSPPAHLWEGDSDDAGALHAQGVCVLVTRRLLRQQ
uniref:Serpin domain-containing protein n=1 Tax=Bos mutus grunniens TaxID=30521 RepID=A0A8B9XQJ9_BOSMU